FTVNEQREGGEHVAMLSYGLWMSEFGGNPDIAGSTIRISDVPHVIVGVMPAGFEFPQGARLWTPLVTNGEMGQNRRAHVLHVIGRLAFEATAAQAEADLRGFVNGVLQQNPGVDPGFQIRVGTLRERLTAPVRPALLVLLGAVGLVLLAACANVANLVLMRNTTRVREFAVRSALGAGHGRLLRQCLAESAVLGLTGALGGALLATWCLRLVVVFGPKGVPRLDEVHADRTLLAFAVGLALLTTLIFGAVPAAGAARTDPNCGLKEGAKGTTSAKGSRMRGTLVIAEVALALILLAGGGLLMNSFVLLAHVWPGFDERNLLTANIFLSPDRYQQQQVAPFFEQVLERVRALPGVESAGAVNTLPLNGGPGTDFVIEGQPEPRRGEEPTADIRVVAGDYFTAMRIPLLQGRWFNAHDTATSAKALVVNQTLADRYWPNQSAIGKRITMLDWGAPLTGEIVAVAGNVKSEGLESAPSNMLYWPEAQFPSIFNNLVVRTTSDPRRVSAALKAAVWSVDRDQPLANIATMEERISTSVATRRMQTLLLSIFAALALSMATIGIYGVIAYSVNARSREIGIRIALGADAGSVRNLVLREGLRWMSTGVALGLAGAIPLAGLLSSLLYGIAPRDPRTFAEATMLLVIVAMVACYLPARRATRLDAMVALRHE
ncbi:MAG TPA: ABC transporter permease, partial [Candidatus Sulfotelmatobacter sp.]|nr:ABC transporter permease [Candidatus Sulfotelmatobacter sp.]